VQAYRANGETGKELETARKTVRIVERHVQMEPADSRAWGMGALLLATLGERERALEWMERAASIVGDDSAAIYNFACLYGRLQMPDKALELLGRSVDLGWSHRDWLDNDPDWDAFREDPHFREILARIR
jgi:adenylate cyclase